MLPVLVLHGIVATQKRSIFIHNVCVYFQAIFNHCISHKKGYLNINLHENKSIFINCHYSFPHNYSVMQCIKKMLTIFSSIPILNNCNLNEVFKPFDYTEVEVHLPNSTPRKML